MHGITLLLVAAIGVDVGWKPAENGELEYIIQIAPEQLQSLKTGDEIEVGVRPMLRSVRRYRIVVGTDPLPRQSARPALENAPPDPEANQSAPVVASAVDQNQLDSAAASLSLPNPPIPQLLTQEQAKSSDRSIMVRPDDAQEASDPRWVAATEEYSSIQLQPIPTQPIHPSTDAATDAVGPLHALPPPPEAPVTPAAGTGNVEMSSTRGVGDPFIPDYRKPESDAGETANQKGYRLGDSVPIEQRAMQASGTVPPTPRLMLPPPPDTDNSSASFDSTSSPQPPSQEQNTRQQEKLALPAPPQIEQDSLAEHPPVLKTAAAPHGEEVPSHQDHNALGAPETQSETVTRSTEPVAAPEGSSGGVWLTLALFASLGGNLFLGYVAWDIRKRFLAAFRGERSSEGNHEGGDASAPAPNPSPQ